MKKMVLGALTGLLVAVSAVQVGAAETNFYDGESGTLAFYEALTENLEDCQIEIVDCADLTAEMLTNRNGKIIIEKIIGEVVSDDLDGEIWNVPENSGDYISYRSVDGAEYGDMILTYCVYNPDTNFEDDILMRFDYIIDKGTED